QRGRAGGAGEVRDAASVGRTAPAAFHLASDTHGADQHGPGTAAGVRGRGAGGRSSPCAAPDGHRRGCRLWHSGTVAFCACGGGPRDSRDRTAASRRRAPARGRGRRDASGSATAEYPGHGLVTATALLASVGDV